MSEPMVNDLNKRFGVGGQVRFEIGEGGLIRATLRADKGEAQVYLHGAHLTHFQPTGQKPVIFLSRQSWFQADKPIRGGVPICWPWFSNAGTPMHGFARLMDWGVESAEKHSDGSVSLTLGLRSDEKTRALWPHDFACRFTLRVSDQLAMTLQTTNTSRSDLSFEEALHTYYAVSDIRQVSVTGLEGATYLDRNDNFQPKGRDQGPIRFSAEYDLGFVNTANTCVIDDPGWKRRIVIEKHNSQSTVVWNPWIDKAKAMPDFGDNEWPDMLCVETCNIRLNRVALKPEQSHEMRAVIRVEA